MNRFFLILFSSFLLFAACKKEDNTTPLTEQKQLNVSYGTDARNKMDIFLPANRDANTPFVLFIHGGSWTSGNKDTLRFFQDTLLKRGIASAFINYRYASATVHYEDMMQDVGAALSYCIDHSRELGIRNNKIVIGGHSAGAHMAMLYGYDFDNASKISAIMSFAGPADLTNSTNLTFFEILNLKQDVEYMVGAPFETGQPLDPKYEAASPIFQVKNIPTLMVYGDEDVLARYDLQALPLEAKLSSLGYTHKLVTLEGAGHTLGFEDPVRMKTIVNEAITWITTYSK